MKEINLPFRFSSMSIFCQAIPGQRGLTNCSRRPLHTMLLLLIAMNLCVGKLTAGKIMAAEITSSSRAIQTNNIDQTNDKNNTCADEKQARNNRSLCSPPTVNGNGQAPMYQTVEQSKQHFALDWVPYDSLTPQQIALTSRYCRGAYLEPLNRSPESHQDPDLSQIVLQGNNMTVDQDTTVHIDGNVTLNQGNRQATAASVTYKKTDNKAHLDGGITFREPGVLLLGHDANIDLENGSAVISDGQYVLHPTRNRGGAETIIKTPDNRFILEKGYYTQCNPVDPMWKLQTSSLELNHTTGMGTAKHMRLEVKDVPILYIPYLKFPIDRERHSGFLFPTIGNTDNDGIDFAIPYYFNIAPNIDATYTPRYMSDRHYMSEGEVRYMNAFQTIAVGVGYLPTDPITQRQRTTVSVLNPGTPDEQEVVTVSESKFDRWLFAVNQTGGTNSAWYSSIDYTAVSDIDYFDDLSTTALDVNKGTRLRRKAELGYHATSWSISTKFEQFQVLEEDQNREPYRLLPEIVYQTFYEHKPSLITFDLTASYSQFNHINAIDDPIAPTNFRVDGKRLHWESTISRPYQYAAGFFTPSLKIYHTDYDLEKPLVTAEPNPNATAFPSRTIPSASVDMGLFFDRDLTINNHSLLQTLEPRLFYLYTDHDNQDDIPKFDTSSQTFSYSYLFRHNRFNGSDRIGDANQISLGLTTRLLEQSSGRELLRASIGQIFYLQNREVEPANDNSDDDSANENNLGDVSNSPIAAELWAPLTNNILATAFLTWDSRDEQIDKARFDIRYDFMHDVIFNIGYQYSRSSSEVSFQLDGEEVILPGRTWAVTDILEQDELLNDLDNIEQRYNVAINRNSLAGVESNSIGCFSQTGEPIVSSAINDTCFAPPAQHVNADLEQADISFVLPFKTNWALINRWSYDVTHNRTLDLISGIEYNNCCWKAQFFTRKEIEDETSNQLVTDYDYGVYLTFQFKGLAGSRGGVAGALEEHIVGYKEREENDR